MSSSTMSTAEVVERGTQIYDQQLRSILEPEHLGKYIVINVETGEYELDKDHRAASDRAKVRWPTARRYATRVGSRYIARVGGRLTVNRK
jgi:hypothetical protein